MNWEQHRVEPKQGVRPDKNLKPDTTRSMCVECWEVFTTDGNFTKHRRGEPEARFCVKPDSVGLTQRDNGDWSSPSKKKPQNWG